VLQFKSNQSQNVRQQLAGIHIAMPYTKHEKIYTAWTVKSVIIYLMTKFANGNCQLQWFPNKKLANYNSNICYGKLIHLR